MRVLSFSWRWDVFESGNWLRIGRGWKLDVLVSDICGCAVVLEVAQIRLNWFCGDGKVMILKLDQKNSLSHFELPIVIHIPNFSLIGKKDIEVKKICYGSFLVGRSSQSKKWRYLFQTHSMLL